MEQIPPYNPRDRSPGSFETRWTQTHIEQGWEPDDYQNIDKQFHFSLLHGTKGAKIRYGCLIEKVDRLNFAKKEVSAGKEINEFTSQDAIALPKVHIPDGMDNTKPTEYYELGYYGDVYLIWEVDKGCNITKVYFSETNKEPDIAAYPYLNYELTRKFEEGVKYGGYLKLGTVYDGAPVVQTVCGDVYVTTTHVPGGEDSSSSDSDSSDSSDSSSDSSDSSDSSSDSSDSSGSDSGGSDSGGSDSGGSVGGSDKSTAIVPVDWSDTGYAALFVLEAPDVRFDDVVVFQISKRRQTVRMDHRYLSVCEPGTIRVCGWSSDKLLSGLSARVDGPNIHIDSSAPWFRSSPYPCLVTLRLTGIRKGFRGKRFPSRTREQFEANERFINSAYPADQKP